MKVVAEILRQGLDGVAIAADPRIRTRYATMIEAGEGQNVRLALGGRTAMPSIGLARQAARG